jgi:sarcosine/dimethylglycine N-methyltransferase
MQDRSVVSFYDHDPLSEWQIVRTLAKLGKRPPHLNAEDLFEFDQDHYGGIEAVEALADLAKITEGRVVLDLGSGLGGPARFLSWRYGCRVTGVDLPRRRGAEPDRARRTCSSSPVPGSGRDMSATPR